MLFFLIAAVLYSPSLSGPWQYDDYAQILDEKVLTGRSLPQLLSSVFRFTAHPDGWTGTRDLVRATFLLNWQWWGNKPAGYRWVNLAIHVINATLVTALVYQLLQIQNTQKTLNVGKSDKSENQKTGKSGSLNLRFSDNSGSPSILSFPNLLAIGAGLLFLIHPLQSQAVAYIAQRFTSMAAMFYLLTVVLYILYNRYNSYKYYIAAILTALFAFNSKEITVTLPVALALITFVLGTRAKGQGSRENQSAFSPKPLALSLLLLPFFLLSLKLPSQIISSSFVSSGNLNDLAVTAIDSLALKQKAVDLTRHDYFLTQINVVGTYLRLAVLPIRQTLDYDYQITKNFDPKTIVLAIFHLGLIGVGGWLLLGPWDKGQGTRVKPSALSPQPLAFSLRLVGLGILWFYLTLLPESSVVPIADLIYEHRVYLPMIGLVIAFSGLAYNIYNRYKNYNPVFLCFLLFTFYSLLSIATFRRAYVWGNEVRLWADIYEKAPNKPRANKNYGVVLAAAGRYEEGVKRLARAVELESDNADYWSNFGTAYLRWGKYEESAGKFLKAFELYILQNPEVVEGGKSREAGSRSARQAAQYMNDYGVSMVQLQRGDEALAGFEKALKIDPGLYAAWLGLGASYNIKGDSEMAIKIFSQTVRDFPDQSDGYNNLAVVLKKAGRSEEAAAVLSRMPKPAKKSP